MILPPTTENQPQPSLVVIGNFDGVHRGHVAVLRTAVSEAERLGLAPIVLTFHPHPAEVLGQKSLKALTSSVRKVELIEAVSDRLRVEVLPFTLELAALSPDEFVERILLAQLGARVVLVGDNFRFGRGRAGDLKRLVELGKDLGFTARAEPLVSDAEGPLSSTRVRRVLESGNVEAAASVLGRPHAVTGVVVHGDHRGRTLGFPTANLEGIPEAMPADGVYAGFARRGSVLLGACVVNVGARPTVERPHAVEVYILDFEGDLYDSRMTVEFVLHLRNQRKFDSLDELKLRIADDVAQARAVLIR